MSAEELSTMPDIETLILPSVQTIQATYEALNDLCEEIDSNSQAILDTLQFVSDLLNVMEGSPGLSGSWGNPMTLPVPAALKAISVTVSRYVENRTGLSLRSWTEFVSTARVQFEDYLVQLGAVAELSQQAFAEEIPQSETSSEQLYHGEELLRETKTKTRLWRPVMAQIPRLSQLADSILEAAKRDTAPPEEPAEAPSKGGWRQKIGDAADKVGQTYSRFTTEHGEWLTRVLSPLYDLREEVSQLGSQVERLSDSISWLEDLLDLEIAQIRAALGEISAEEVDILSKRIAVTILIPRLNARLTDAQKDVATHQTYLQNLNAAYGQAKIGDGIYQTLAAEYQAGLDAAETRLGALEREADAWRANGRSILEAGMIWLQEELQIVTARELVGQLPCHEAQQRSTALKKETNRFEEAERSLATL